MSGRRFHIRCDMEGVSGVVSMAQVTPWEREYGQAREWFMAELLALIEGLLAGGAGGVTVYDEHWFGRNVDLSRVPRGVRVCCGKPPYRSDWPGGLSREDDGLILHGLHSMEGTGQTLCHTYEPDFAAIRINGTAVGEIGMEAAVASDFGVPLVLVIGDSGGADEARALVPGVRTVVTKESQSQFGAECHGLADVVEWIRDAGRGLAEAVPEVEMFAPGGPVEIEMDFKAGNYREALRQVAGPRFRDESTLVMGGANTTAVWAEYWQLKLAAQEALN